MSSKEPISNALYDTAAQYGRFRSGISVVLGTLIALIFLFLGGYLVFRKQDTNKQETTATVNNVNCSFVAGSSRNTSYSCNLNLTYNVDNKLYNNSLITTSSAPYYKGQQITIIYDITNPNIISQKTLGSRTFGFILSCIAIVILAMVWGYNYLVTKNKTVAAIYGTESFFNWK